MNVTIRNNFEHDLEKLQHDLIKMGGAVEQAIQLALEALRKQDVDLAEKILQDDDIIDNLELDIEEKCMRLLARQQPMAKDLRIIGTGLKIVTDLERIADHAGDIAKITKQIAGEPYIKPLIDIPKMAEAAQKMVRMSLDAYVSHNMELAERVLEADDEVDNMYYAVYKELLQIMIQDQTVINQATGLLFIVSYLERIADHATNIAEWVIYMLTGKIIS